jgi:hypothetical protein
MKMVYCFESRKLIICMPTLYIKQLKQHTPKGNSWKWGRKLYGQVCKLTPIYSLNLFLEFAYTF